MAYAILRFDKLKTSLKVGQALAHHLRLDPMENIDPSKTGHNRIIVGSDTRFPEGVDRAGIIARINSTPRRQKNCVPAVGFVMTASPEWEGFKDSKTLDAWVEASVAWLKSEWGEQNVVFVNLQLDETTPHLQGFVIPADERGYLNASKLMQKDEKRGINQLRRMQDEYHAAVASFGLQRGELNSPRKHVSLKKWREGQEQLASLPPEPDFRINTPMPKPGFLKTYSEADLKQHRIAVGRDIAGQALEREAALKAAAAKAKDDLARAMQSAQELANLKAVNNELRRDNAEFRERLKVYRSVSAVEVAAKLYPMELDETGAEVFIGGFGTFRVASDTSSLTDGAKTIKGGLNAVMALTGCDFNVAVAWMEQNFDEVAVNMTIADTFKADAPKTDKLVIPQANRTLNTDAATAAPVNSDVRRDSPPPFSAFLKRTISTTVGAL